MRKEAYENIDPLANDTEEISSTESDVMHDGDFDGIREEFTRHKEMYGFGGSPPLVEYDIGKYIKSKEKVVGYLPELIREDLECGDWEARLRASALIPYAPESSRRSLRELTGAMAKKGLDDTDFNVSLKAAAMVQYAPEMEQLVLRENILEVCKKGIKEGMWAYRLMAVDMIEFISEEARVELVGKALEDADEFVRMRGATMVRYVPTETRTALEGKLAETLERDMDNSQVEIVWGVLDAVRYAPPGTRKKILMRGLAHEDWYIRQKAAEMISYAPDHERQSLKEQVPGLIEEGLADSREYVGWKAVDMIQYAPEEDQEALEEKMKRILVGERTPDALRKLAEKTPLYKNEERFFRKKFFKTGTETTLLDRVPGAREKTLRKKVIVRHIDPRAYVIWAKAFEAGDFWEKKGFSYVPIESIVRARMHGQVSVDVFTGVIEGPSIRTWWENGGTFQWEIRVQKERIRAGLEELGIAHGHLHDHNFVLYFPRSRDGEPDISQEPRVYAIDFDAAISSGGTDSHK